MTVSTILYKEAIPGLGDFSGEEVRKIKIKDNGEDLIPMSLVPEKIIVRSQYYLQGIKGALPECYIREGNLKRLIEAADMLPAGYRLLIFDGWRPEKVQVNIYKKYLKELKENMPKKTDDELKEIAEKFVARPSQREKSPSPHITGGAVDLTIVDDRGMTLDMGTGFDETTNRTYTRYYEDLLKKEKALTSREGKILKNRRQLFGIMSDVGFINYPNEWWHYDYGDQLWAYIKKEDNARYGKAKPDLRWVNC